ncbi:MAG TPA: hypothetical protein VH082_10975 [Rudaea sp.]|jgi:hypothetical protein|nr:hypothetical protein [Rudaea sp.]
MSEHTATIRWHRGEHPFAKGRFPRHHERIAGGGVVVGASSSPHGARTVSDVTSPVNVDQITR